MSEVGERERAKARRARHRATEQRPTTMHVAINQQCGGRDEPSCDATSLPYRRRFPPAPPPAPPLLQFVVLSILLHVLVVLVFGNPQRGGGGPLGAWRDVPFAVTLRALVMPRESPWKPSRGADQGSAGSPLARRATRAASGAGATTPPVPERPRVEAPSRTTEAAPPPAPPPRAEPAIEAPAAPPPRAERAIEAPAREEPPVPGTLPRLDLGAPEVVDKSVVPNADIRPQEPPTETVPRADLEAPRKVPKAQSPVPERREAPPMTPTAPELVAPPKEEPVTSPKPESPAPGEAPAEALPRSEPEAPPKLPPVVAPATPQPETPPSALPRVEEEAAPKIESEKPPLVEPPAKLDVPAEAPARVAPEAAPAAEKPIVAPAPTSPREPPAAIAPSRESAPAPAIERAITPAAPQAAPSEAPAEAPSRTEREAPRKIDTEVPRAAQPAASREAPAAAPVTRLNYGAPPDVDDIFTPRKSGDPPAAGAPAPIDIDAARKARESSRITYGRTGIIPLSLSPPPPEPESKLGRAIQKAAQPDCRDAYAAMGLLAIPFLLKDTVTDTGCRW